MIISASRRTDIPAFYSEWFFNRLNEGFVLVRNPMNYYQVSQIDLNPKNVDCFVFWSKNPKPFLKSLDLLKKYKYYFQFTLTPYGKAIECNLPSKTELIATFKTLSSQIGRELVLWRYDPILFNHEMNVDFHLESFEKMAKQLSGYTRKCIISFFDDYKFAKANCKSLRLISPNNATLLEFGQKLQPIASKYGLIVETCAESIDLSKFGIAHGKCVDNRLLFELLGYDVEIEKDKNQRDLCGCVKSVDIGAYSTCLHECRYCYATRHLQKTKKPLLEHDPCSEFLVGKRNEKDKIYIRKESKLRIHQPRLFD